jgi:hypothetical protein
VAAARDRFAERGCSVLVVAQAKPDFLSRFVVTQPAGIAFASDPERAAYRAFGLERTRWQTFFRPRVLLGYLRGMLRGYRVKLPAAGEDVLQLGGDFILDRSGAVLLAYRSADPTDRPTTDALLAALPSPPPMGGNPGPDDRKVDSPPGGG